MQPIKSLAEVTAVYRLAELAEAMRVHAKACRTCRSFTQAASAYCPEGYELAREHRTVKAAIACYQEVQDDDQGELF